MELIAGKAVTRVEICEKETIYKDVEWTGFLTLPFLCQTTCMCRRDIMSGCEESFQSSRWRSRDYIELLRLQNKFVQLK